MKKNNFFTSLPFKQLVGVIFGIIAGIILNKTDGASLTVAILNIVVTVKYVLGQLINFCVPLIIIGFIAPSITKLGNSASRMLGVALVIAYVSSIGAALFSTGAGYILIPHLSIVTDVEGLKTLPEVVFELSIPQIMSVMSALVFSIMVGLAATWNQTKLITGTMILFCLLLGIFALGAPGVPGGTVMASLGLITGVLGFNETGTALMLTIFALQDSFGTACNVTGDGALTLILTGYAKRHNIKEQNISVDL